MASDYQRIREAVDTLVAFLPDAPGSERLAILEALSGAGVRLMPADPIIEGEVCPVCDSSIPAQCGTNAAYLRHRYRGLDADKACKAAHALHGKAARRGGRR